MPEAGQETRRWGARTGEERRALRRDQLTRAALSVYGRVGFRNATVRAVCEAAGLTERYFYESFPNSEALLSHAFREVTAQLVARIRAVAGAAEGGPRARARAGLEVYLTQLRDDPAAARVFLVEMSGISPELDAVVGESLDLFGALLLEVLEVGTCPPLLLRGVVGGGLHIAIAWIASGYAAPVDVVVDNALDLYLVITRSDVA